MVPLREQVRRLLIVVLLFRETDHVMFFLLADGVRLSTRTRTTRWVSKSFLRSS